MTGGRARTVLVLVAWALILGACAGPSARRDPAAIKPTWKVRNSPVPVPYPTVRPRTPTSFADAIRQTHQAQAVQRAPESGGLMVQVERGDTVYALSRRHEADVRAIIAANNLEPPYALQVGDRIRIPAARYHVVARGETTYSVSRAYGVDLATLARLNELQPPYVLYVGQRLMLPSGSAEAATVAQAPPAVAVAPNAAAPSATVRPAPLPPAPTRSGFIWPLKGRILSGFGAKDGGLHNDGVNIAAAHGAPVAASDAGVVAYAGSDLKAYGNLILIQHQNGWVTAYAHNHRMLVARGQQVRRGEVIAHVGAVGSVTSPQLHFEIRQGRRAVNPLLHLPK